MLWIAFIRLTQVLLMASRAQSIAVLGCASPTEAGPQLIANRTKMGVTQNVGHASPKRSKCLVALGYTQTEFSLGRNPALQTSQVRFGCAHCQEKTFGLSWLSKKTEKLRRYYSPGVRDSLAES